MEKSCLSRVLFSVSGRKWTWGQALACAEHSGELASDLEQLRSSQAAVAEAMARGICLPDHALQDAITEWRYDLNLISAQETEHWLSARDLNLADLGEHINRELWRGELPDCESDQPLSGPELARALWVQACLNNDLARLIRPLVQRVLCAELKTPESDSPEIQAPIFADCAIEMPLEAAFEACVAEFANPDACTRALAVLRPNLLRVRYQAATFLNHDAAAEARLCVRDDGEDLADVAERVSARSEAGVIFPSDLDVASATRLLSAAPGECTLPSENYTIFVVQGKIEPDLADEPVARRVRHHCLATALRPHLGKLEWAGIQVDID